MAAKRAPGNSCTASAKRWNRFELTFAADDLIPVERQSTQRIEASARAQLAVLDQISNGIQRDALQLQHCQSYGSFSSVLRDGNGVLYILNPSMLTGSLAAGRRDRWAEIGGCSMRELHLKQSPLRWHGVVALAAAAALAVGCGGGGGGGDSGGGQGGVQIGVARVVVVDAYGAPVSGAAVTLNATSSPAFATNAEGVALVAAPPGAASLSISVPSFIPAVVQATLSTETVTSVPVILQRVTAPAGGSLATRSDFRPVRSSDGRRLDFEVELVVVGADAQAVTGLTAADFRLLDCQPDAATPAADCLRNAPADHAYVGSAAAAGIQLVPGQAVLPHTVGLLIDQSGSIANSDRLNARLFSTKTMISNLAPGDQVVMGAFADGNGARLPQQPMTMLGTVVNKAAAPLFFTRLDVLAGQSGGQTPLHASIDAMRVQIVGDASLTPGQPRAMVVFTDGVDSYCIGGTNCAQRRQQVIDAARANAVRLFTIGLSGDIDVEALSHLATASGGAMLYADSVEQLIPLYGSLGRLMSLGLPTYRLRFSIDAGQGGVFAAGQTVLARARVNVLGKTVNIPFAVGIP